MKITLGIYMCQTPFVIREMQKIYQRKVYSIKFMNESNFEI